MLNPRIIRRSFSLLQRGTKAQLLQSAAREGPETLRIQRVRFVKPNRLTTGNLLKYAFYGTVLYAGMSTASRFLDEEDEKDSRVHEWELVKPVQPRIKNSGGVQQGGDQEERLETLVFIPTGFSRYKDQPYYKRTDPEWQEYLRMSQDSNYKTDVEVQLSKIFFDFTKTQPQLAKVVGKPIRWESLLFFRYPHSPPPAYEQPGIEIDEALNVKWTTRTVSYANNFRFNRIVWPVPAAIAFYNLAKQHALRVTQGAKSLVFAVDDTAKKNEEKPQKRRPRTKAARPTSSSPPATTPSNLPSTTSSQSAQLEPTASSAKPPAITTNTSQVQSTSDRATFSIPIFTLDVAPLKKTLTKQWRPVPISLAPGSVLVDGSIKVIGQKGEMRFVVVAVWDIRTNRYLHIECKQNTFTPFDFVPRGGK